MDDVDHPGDDVAQREAQRADGEGFGGVGKHQAGRKGNAEDIYLPRGGDGVGRCVGAGLLAAYLHVGIVKSQELLTEETQFHIGQGVGRPIAGRYAPGGGVGDLGAYFGKTQLKKVGKNVGHGRRAKPAYKVGKT